MAAHEIPWHIVTKDSASAALERVRVAVIDARGDRVEVIGQVMEFPAGVEWPALPEIGDDGRSHYVEITGPGVAHCLPECWCQSSDGD